jgi:uncharacterized protein (DUF885 family)
VKPVCRNLSPGACLLSTVGAALLLNTGASNAADFTSDQIAAESAKANALLDHAFQDLVDRSPMRQAFLGIKKDEDKWDDRSDAHAVEDLAHQLGFLADLKRTVNYDALDRETKLSYRLFDYETERAARDFQFRFDDYIIGETGGPLTGVPDALINRLRLDDLHDALAYVARLRGIGQLFDQLIVNLKEEQTHGVVPPRWVFPKVAEIGRNVISGAPFDDSGKASPIWADFTNKVARLNAVDDRTKEQLIQDGRAALIEAAKPAYERVLAYWAELEKSATDDDGVWKIPDGSAYYANQLADMTTTGLTADEIHAIGLKEVARIQGEMRGIMKEVNFKGDLQAFFHFLRTDPRFYLPNTDAGRKEYLAQAQALVTDMKGRLDQLFLRKPKADLLVRATEPYREKTASKAFYFPPAPDGSRPGIFYATLYDVHEMPTYEIDALVYHEGIPGHHMQISIAQELTGLPRFRKYGGHGFTAYIEGWALYCEELPKEIGLYKDPYHDFGRLAMELWRAVRLVVDTGIHAKRWTRQQAIEYFVANNPLSEAEAAREIDRYIMNPGQATAYKIGMMKILELRSLAKRELGDKFDLREFHDVILRDGALPLNILEEQARTWIATKRTQSVSQ